MTQVARNRSGSAHFVKGGPSPNPAGRPKKDFDLVTRCRELTPAIIERYAEMGAKARTAADVAAGRVVIEYAFDRPKQRMHESDITAAAEMLVEAMIRKKREEMEARAAAETAEPPHDEAKMIEGIEVGES